MLDLTEKVLQDQIKENKDIPEDIIEKKTLEDYDWPLFERFEYIGNLSSYVGDLSETVKEILNTESHFVDLPKSVKVK